MSTSPVSLRIAVTVMLVILPLIAVVAIVGVFGYWGFGIVRLGGESTHMVLAEVAPEPDRRIYGLLAALMPLATGLYALWRLFTLFLHFRRGELVGHKTVRDLRAFSLFLALTVIAGFALSGVMRWAMGRFDDAPLWTHLGMSSTHSTVLLLAVIVYVASHVIEEGYAYKRETEDYI